MKRIIFLDMDGVCCSGRVSLLYGKNCIDSMAVQFLNRLHQSVPYSLVASSSWRKDYFLPIVLQAVGCMAPFAEPWKIELNSPRSQAIEKWLCRNAPSADFLILDDEDFDWTPLQKARWICCDPDNGITLQDMRRAFRLFGAEPPDAMCGLRE